jgi:hypothetical protein
LWERDQAERPRCCPLMRRESSSCDIQDVTAAATAEETAT